MVSPFVDRTRPAEHPNKYTLCFTQRCNLRCDYCYVDKARGLMSLETARAAVDFIYRHGRGTAGLEIGFFGGEPLLDFERMRDITAVIQEHPEYRPDRVRLTVTTNGTCFSDEIVRYLVDNSVRFCVSCDGPPAVQDELRRTVRGQGSGARVERNLREAVRVLPMVLVNTVIHPRTFRHLPTTFDWFADLGIRHIYFNADYSAAWSAEDTAAIPGVYDELADRYIARYLARDPRFCRLLDGKVAVLLRGGYGPMERCRMGQGEIAFSWDGGIYPCERLIGDGKSDDHRIGDVTRGVDLSRLSCKLSSRRARPNMETPSTARNAECAECGIRPYCMNWCGCSNSFMTGWYDRVGPFLCASERAAVEAALRVITELTEQLGPVFLRHFAGTPHANGQPDASAECDPDAATPGAGSVPGMEVTT